MKFDFDTYIKTQPSIIGLSSDDDNSSQKQKVDFLSNYLRNNGDSVIVRFPYRTSADFDVETCHEVAINGYKYKQKVACARHDNDPREMCDLCAQSIPVTRRFFVKAIAYIPEGSSVKIVPVVWDRPLGYAQELAEKLSDYGDLSQKLFKIKKLITAGKTSYSTDIITNTDIFKPEIYVPDFSLIANVDPARILMKTYKKYMELNSPKPTAEALAGVQDYLYPNDLQRDYTNQQATLQTRVSPTAPVTPCNPTPEVTPTVNPVSFTAPAQYNQPVQEEPVKPHRTYTEW